MQDQINENLKLTNQDLGNIESKIMKIKENLIACVIMNVIRNLNEKDKRSLRKFCDFVVSEKMAQKEEGEINFYTHGINP